MADRDQTGDDNEKTGRQTQSDDVQGGGHGGGQPKTDDGMTPSTKRIHDGGDTAGAPPQQR